MSQALSAVLIGVLCHACAAPEAASIDAPRPRAQDPAQILETETYGDVRRSWLEARGHEVSPEGVYRSHADRLAVARGWIPFDAGFIPATAEDEVVLNRFPCGDAWLGIDDANDFHSRLLRWWKLRSSSFRTYSTCQRTTAQVALEWMDHVAPVLEGLFGRSPRVPPTVIVLRNKEQYNAFAVTQGEIGELPTDSMGFAAFHYAFPCDRWLDRDASWEHPGAACALWDDRTVAGNGWGPYAIRHAAAQAFIESLDPSPKALKVFAEDPHGPFPSEMYWSEKRLPLWLRYGVAVYCERFLIGADGSTSVSDWSLGELTAQGGPLDLETTFAFPFDPKRPAEAQRLILTAGALVAFFMDGVAGPGESVRSELLASMGDSTTRAESVVALERIEAALLESEDAFQAFVAR